jgi:hypothetical protein
MRAWLLTCTTYGTWLPGDPRGSVTSVRDQRPSDGPWVVRFEHDLPGEPYEGAITGLEQSARGLMNGPAIYFDLEKAEAVSAQFLETAGYRGWTVRALAVLYNHFHLVVEVLDDPGPEKVLADFKAYGSRTLNRKYGQPPSETWWTSRGSKRKLADENALGGAIYYVLHKQPNPLVVWSPETGRIVRPSEAGASQGRAGGVTRASRERERPEGRITPVAHAPGSPEPMR